MKYSVEIKTFMYFSYIRFGHYKRFLDWYVLLQSKNLELRRSIKTK